MWLCLVDLHCQPQLSSSIDSLELSGEQCPGILTLTCDARNFGISGSISWFVGDERVGEFDVVDDFTPFTTTTTRPDLLNATVQLTTAIFTGGQFSFINFTLSASVSDLLLLQGRNISCGSLGLRSSFGIREFTINKEATSYRGMLSYKVIFSNPVHFSIVSMLGFIHEGRRGEAGGGGQNHMKMTNFKQLIRS